MTLCACGCGGEIIWKLFHKRYGTPKYIWGHSNTDKPRSEESKQRTSEKMKKLYADGKLIGSMTGKHFSNATKKKMSETRKKLFIEGKIINAKKGTTSSEETKQKQSKTMKKLFAEGKIIHSRGMLGKHHSEEAKKKNSESHKGKPAWSKGIKMSKESRQKMSESKKGKPTWNKGKNMSEEFREKMSLTHKGKKLSEKQLEGLRKVWKSQEYKEKRRLQRLHQVFPTKDSKPELKLQAAITNLGIPFKKHIPILGQPDIFIKPNICVFVDGCWFHGCEQHIDKNKFTDWVWDQKREDPIITQKLQNDGYTVLRFWEHDINKNIESVINKIKETIQIKAMI